MLTRLPVKLRVTVVFAAVMAIVLSATGLFLYLRLESELNRSIDSDLESRAHQLVREVRVREHGLGESARTLIDRRPDEFAQVLARRGHKFTPQHSGPPALSEVQIKAARQEQTTADLPGFHGSNDPERLLALPFRFENHDLIAVVGASLDNRDQALSNLLTLLLIGGPVALLLASLAAYWTVGAALRPVEAMRRRAAEVSASGSEQRLPVPPARDELQRLGETLNKMLDRLETAIERERAFVDDASHELRTPLAAHKAELELALRYGASSEELRAAIASAIEEADRLSQLAEDLLVIARSDKDGMALKLERLEVSELFETVRSRLSNRAERNGRPLMADEAPGMLVQADRMRVEQALGNLVENALRHGDGAIRLWAHGVDGRVELHVSDQGHGFPPDFLPHAFERFRQADAARSTDGTGLGLAIVAAIAQAHSGRAIARNANGGGADVWIELGVAEPL